VIFGHRQLINQHRSRGKFFHVAVMAEILASQAAQDLNHAIKKV